MSRGLISSLLLLAVAPLAVGRMRAAEPGPRSADCPVLQRFLSIDEPPLTSYRALRHLEAHAERFTSRASMDVWTEADSRGFRYRIVSEDGSDLIRGRVFRAILDTERDSWGKPDRARVTPANYTFEDRGAQPDGLAELGVRPRRRDESLIVGAIFLRPGDGDLVRLAGQLSKSPSFWARSVEIDWQFRRVAGVRMPVALDSVANVRIYGRSSLTMTYEYESVNGRRAVVRAVDDPAR